MMRSLHFAILGAAFTFTLVAACGDDAGTITAATTGAGGTTAVSSGIGGIQSGPGGSGGAGANTGGQGQATPVWDAEYGGAANVFVTDVATDNAGNIVVVGSFGGGTAELGGAPLSSAGQNDVFVAKYDANGDHVWSVGFGGNDNDGAQAVAVDAQGAIWVGGQFKGSINFGGATLSAADGLFSDAFLVKLDASGSHLFSDNYGVGQNNADAINALAVDGANNVVLAGVFQSSISFGGSTLNAAGGAGDYDMFLAKLDASGNHVFSDAFGGVERDEALAVATGSGDVMAVAGFASGDIDLGGGNLTHGGDGARAVVAVFGAGGNPIFSKLYVGSELQDVARVTGVAFSGGDVFVTGNFKGSIDLGGGALETPSTNDDIFVARHDASGGFVYGVRFGGNGAEKASGIAVDAGYATISGWFKGVMEVHDDSVLSATATINDAFVLRVGPPGNGFWGVQLHAVENAQARSVALSGGDVVVAGDFSGELDFGSGPVGTGATQDLFIARFVP